MEGSKPIYQSKTVWLAALYPLALALEPTVRDFAAQNPTWVGAAVSGLFLFLRVLTGQPVTFTGKKP